MIFFKYNGNETKCTFLQYIYTHNDMNIVIIIYRATISFKGCVAIGFRSPEQ